jgi:hypothetical protein
MTLGRSGAKVVQVSQRFPILLAVDYSHPPGEESTLVIFVVTPPSEKTRIVDKQM